MSNLLKANDLMHAINNGLEDSFENHGPPPFLKNLSPEKGVPFSNGY